MSRRVKDLYFYELLGIAASATDEDIKKAYRKLAIKWHPDKNIDNREQATEMFQLIAEAYATLIDPQKRIQYDMYGRDSVRFDDDDQSSDNGMGNNSASSTSGMNNPAAAFHHHFHHHPHVSLHFADNLFRMFFGGHDPFGSIHSGATPTVNNMNRGIPTNPFQMHPGFSSFGGGGGFGAFGGGGFGLLMPSMMMSTMDPFHSFNTGRSLFDDAMLMNGPGNSMFAASSSSTSTSFGPDGTSTSVSTVSTIENGKRLTRTTKTIRYADGRVEQTQDEKTQDLQPQLQNGNGSYPQQQQQHRQQQQRLTYQPMTPTTLQRHDSFDTGENTTVRPVHGTSIPSAPPSSSTFSSSLSTASPPFHYQQPPQYTSTMQHQRSFQNQGGQPFANSTSYRTTSNPSHNSNSYSVPVTVRPSFSSSSSSQAHSHSSSSNSSSHTSSQNNPYSTTDNGSFYPRRL